MGKRRKRPSREELEALVLSADSVKEIALAIDANAETVRRWIRHYELPQPIDIRRAQVANALSAGEVSIQRNCAVDMGQRRSPSSDPSADHAARSAEPKRLRDDGAASRRFSPKRQVASV